jgi:hypothetical protein
MFSFSNMALSSAPNVPDRAPTIIVAGLWPPRKRDFLTVLARIKHKPYWRGLFAPRWRNA